MRKLLLGLLSLLALACPDKCLLADVLTFDSLTAGGVAVPNGYGGLNWSNFGVLNGAATGVGYANGVVSPNNIVYNYSGLSAATMDNGGTFTLISAYFTAAWRDGMQITVSGYNGALLVGSDQFIVNTSGPVLETFNFAGITTIDFSTSGGTIHPGYNLADTNGEQLVMDNFSYSTPEPGGLALAAVGTVGLFLAARRRNV